jgi:predicted dehydrogenase
MTEATPIEEGITEETPVEEETIETRPIKVGIAGLGRSGWGIHARLLEPLSERYKVVAACDLIEERREEMAERFGCRTYADYDEFVEDEEMELVTVALPSYLHPSATVKALQAGKHAISEKPMATTLAEADEMIAAAEEADRVLTIFQNRRYFPDFIKVQEVIDSGVLGDVFFIRMAWQHYGRRWDWQTLQEYDGGTLNNTGPHALDQVLELYGDEMPQAYCNLKRILTLGDANDHAKLIFKGPESGMMVDLEVTSACAYPQEQWLVMGEWGTLAGSFKELRWKYIDPDDLEPREVDTNPTPDRSYNREEYDWTEETWTSEEYEGPTSEAFYLDLYETIRNDAPLFITPESVRKQVAILEYCHEKCGL